MITIIGFNSEGFEVHITGDNYSALSLETSRLGLKPVRPENLDKTYKHTIESLMLREHVNADGSITTVADLYRPMALKSKGQGMNWETPVWSLYLNRDIDIAELEAQSGLSLAELPVRKSDGETVPPLKRTQGKVYKTEIALVTPFEIGTRTHVIRRDEAGNAVGFKVYKQFSSPKTPPYIENGGKQPFIKDEQEAPESKPRVTTQPTQGTSQPPGNVDKPSTKGVPGWVEAFGAGCRAHLGITAKELAEKLTAAKYLENYMQLMKISQAEAEALVRKWLADTGEPIYSYHLEVRPRPNQVNSRNYHFNFGFGTAIAFSREMFKEAGIIEPDDWGVMGDYDFEQPIAITIKYAKKGNYFEVAGVAPHDPLEVG